MRPAIFCLRLLLLGLFLVPFGSEAATKYWIGGTAGNFNDGTRWSTASGGANNTTAPGAADLATFDGNGLGNCAMTATVNVAGISIVSGYTGTITQNAGIGVTVGASNYNQAAGTFAGGNAAIAMNGTFTLSGGTFTSTSGTLTTGSNWTKSAGTFNHNSGTVQFFNANSQSLTLTGTHTFNNVTIGGAWTGDVLTIANGGGAGGVVTTSTQTVSGTLNFAGSACCGNPVVINGNTIVAQGNIVQGSAGASGTTALTISGAGAQSLTGGGAGAYLLPLTINKSSYGSTLTLVGTIGTAANWTYTAGTIAAGTSTVQFFNANSQSLTLTGSHTLNNVTIGGAWTGDVLTIAANASRVPSTLTVSGTLNFAGSACCGNPVTINGGTIAAQGDIVQGSAGATGTTALTISGAGAQSLTGGGAGAYLLPLNINKPSGTLTLVGTIGTAANWTYTAGTLAAGTSTVQFFNANSQSLTITNSHTLNNVTIGGAWTGDVLAIASTSINVPATLTVSGTLNFAGSACCGNPVTINGGAIAAQGNVIQGSAGATGTTLVTFSGTGAQTWTSSGGQIPGATVTVNKSSGTVTLGSNVAANTGSQALSISAGTLDQGASYSLTTGAVSLGLNGVWTNTGSGGVTLGGDVLNKGLVTFSGGGAGCGADVILIRSSVSGTQRLWNTGGNNGTFSMEDVDVKDQGGSTAITAYSSTQGTNVGVNWTFNAGCSSVVTPGGFNAYETATAAGAITGVIKTKIAGSGVSLDLIVLNPAKNAIQTTFTGTVRVEVLDSSDNSAALDANNCRSTWTSLQTLAPDIALVAGDNGRKTISLTQANSYRDARLRITYPAGAPTVTGCSTDNFAIRPSAFASFSATDLDWASAGTTRSLASVATSGGNVHKAGQPFTVRATAVNASAATTTNYTGSALSTVTACVGAACSVAPGAVTLTATAVAGAISAPATYSEAGSFSLQLNDATFAAVDAADGSTAVERTISSPVLTVGRFVPDHFDLTSLATPVLRTFGSASCGARSFTYLGQPFGYATVPQATVLARNASGTTTANYSGALWKLTGAAITQSYTPTPASPTVDTSAATLPALTSNGNGTGLLATASGDLLKLTRPAAVLAPFNANIALAWSAQDATEAAVTGNGTISTTTPLTFSSIAFDAGAQMRFGVLHAAPAYGSELVDLPVQVDAQYWDGLRMATNSADQCTALPAGVAAMSNYQRNLAACKTAIAAAPATLSNGRSFLKLAKPGAGNGGSVDLGVQLGATASGQTCTTVGGATTAAATAALSWLQGKWNGAAAYDQNPSTRASFGLYRSPLVYQRENY